MSTSTTTNTELRDFQRAVKAAIDSVRHYSPSIVGDVERSLGLDSFVDDQVITVKVTVPATDPAEAQSQVEEQLSSLYLPSGWAASVDA